MFCFPIFCFNNCNFVFFPSVFDFHQAADGIQEQQRQEQAGKKYVFCMCSVCARVHSLLCLNSRPEA